MGSLRKGEKSEGEGVCMINTSYRSGEFKGRRAWHPVFPVEPGKMVRCRVGQAAGCTAQHMGLEQPHRASKAQMQGQELKCPACPKHRQASTGFGSKGAHGNDCAHQ